MYVLPDVQTIEAPPSFGGYANIVLHSKFREKYLRLEDGKLKVYEGEFTERPLQKIDLTGKCFLQILDDRSIGLEFSCEYMPESVPHSLHFVRIGVQKSGRPISN